MLQFLNFALLRSGDSPKDGFRTSPHLEFSLQNGVKKLCYFLLNCAAIFKFCAAPSGDIHKKVNMAILCLHELDALVL